MTKKNSRTENIHWKTEDIYRSDRSWQLARKKLLKDLPRIKRYRGRLKGRPSILACLKLCTDFEKELDRITCYADRCHDQDTRASGYQGIKAISEKVEAEVNEAMAFIEPELLALPAATLRPLISHKDFAEYDQFLKDLLRQKKHVRNADEEALLAGAAIMADSGHSAHSTFLAADLRFPKVTNEQGKSELLTLATWPRLRASGNRSVRKGAFDAFFGTFTSYQNTLANLLNAQVNANLFNARAHNYPTVLSAALDDDAIPESIYHQLIKAANQNLPILHRYLEFRGRRLKVKKLRYIDLYAPIIGKADLEFPYSCGCDLLVDAVAPLGDAYQADLKMALDPKSGWVDPFPAPGKRSGAYMDGSAYDVHPYVLGNYLGDYDSLSMLAHEMGHAMHSFYSNRTQPYAKADYSIFVAEVASTLNELLLARSLANSAKGRKAQAYILGEVLENYRLTFFRQAMFAEFELEMYRRAEANEALTVETLSELYLKIVRKYYGHEQGISKISECYGIEWAYIPHFYYGYYVFQYATGITAATALAEGIVSEGAKARDKYLKNLLHAGASAPPLTLLKRAGVDLSTAKPYSVAMGHFAQTLSQVESLLDSK